MNSEFCIPTGFARCNDEKLFKMQFALAKTIYNQLRAHADYDPTINDMIGAKTHADLCCLALDLAAQQTMMLINRFTIEPK